MLIKKFFGSYKKKQKKSKKINRRVSMKRIFIHTHKTLTNPRAKWEKRNSRCLFNFSWQSCDGLLFVCLLRKKNSMKKIKKDCWGWEIKKSFKFFLMHMDFISSQHITSYYTPFICCKYIYIYIYIYKYSTPAIDMTPMSCAVKN